MKTNRKTLLEQMFDGNFLPSEHIRSKDPEYLPTCNEAEKEYLYLCKLLSEDDRKHFRHLLELRMRLSGMDSCACFTCGFQYGALLMLEIMDSRDVLCACP